MTPTVSKLDFNFQNTLTQKNNNRSTIDIYKGLITKHNMLAKYMSNKIFFN